MPSTAAFAVQTFIIRLNAREHPGRRAGTSCERRIPTFVAGQRLRLFSRAGEFPRVRASLSKQQTDETVQSADAEHVLAPDPFLHGRGTATCPTRGWIPADTTGSAKIAADHGLDIPNLSRAYGMVLGRQMLQLGVEDLVPERIIDGISFGWRNEEVPMDLTLFENKIQHLLDENADDSSLSKEVVDPLEMIALSQMYGYLLGTTLRMSCLELQEHLVADGFRTVIVEPDIALPLDPQEYDRQFMELQQIAAALMHDSNIADANRFFNLARRSPGVIRLRPDGLILGLEGTYRAPTTASQALGSDTALVVVAGRLLDGRSFLVPTYSDGIDREADTISIPLPGVPEGLSLGVVGMRPGEVRTVYIHPDASDGIAALFSAQPFPPQSVLIFDFKFVGIEQIRANEETGSVVEAETN
jgi:peptidylprolyl isomerase